MNLSTLSDLELSASLEKLTGNEREVTLRILYHLIEIERRGLFRELGYSSLFDYCTRKLKYSEGSAYKRITASRCLKDNPELCDSFLRGEITLCTITTAARALKEEATTVAAIAGKSKRDVERMVAKSVNRKPKERIKTVMLAAQELPLFTQAAQQEARYELKFSINEDVYKKLEAAKAELSTSLGRELTLEALLEKLLDIQQKPKVRTQHSKDSDTRYIPKQVSL